ncbi:hypothetical protein [Microbacterium sp. PAMC22086]|uniref:hypothetical protein n=1 Tax=Microbacterium sp. PAMC22086 TaxID=2861281 RepID=UPI001C6296BB|nr:hypothetical protein [Microbacterium sp. PAMC22086]QYG11517.1 hypothetical protein KY497_14875 [Microbacterium sp. PAMC22086]
MQSTVKLVCHGTGAYVHKPRTVAQFGHDGDGWARIRNEGPIDPLLFVDGEVVQNHQLTCDRCTRDDYYTPDQLYPELDKVRTAGRVEVDAAKVARALS